MRTFSSVGTADPTTASRVTRGLLIFFGTAFSLSWLIVGIMVLLVGRTSLPAMVAVSLFLFGPLVAAFGAARTNRAAQVCTNCWPNTRAGARRCAGTPSRSLFQR